MSMAKKENKDDEMIQMITRSVKDKISAIRQRSIGKKKQKEKINEEKKKGKGTLINGIIGTLLTTPDINSNILMKSFIGTLWTNPDIIDRNDIIKLLPLDTALSQLSDNTLSSSNEPPSLKSNAPEPLNSKPALLLKNGEKSGGAAEEKSSESLDSTQNPFGQQNKNPILQLFNLQPQYDELKFLKEQFTLVKENTNRSFFNRLYNYITYNLHGDNKENGMSNLSRYALIVALISFLETIFFYHHDQVDETTTSSMIFLLSTVLMQFQTDSNYRQQLNNQKMDLEQQITAKVKEISKTFTLYNNNELLPKTNTGLGAPAKSVPASLSSQMPLLKKEKSLTRTGVSIDTFLLNNPDPEEIVKISIEEAKRRLIELEDILDDKEEGINTQLIEVIDVNMNAYVNNNSLFYSKLRDVVDSYNRAVGQYEEPDNLTHDFIDTYPELSEKIGDLFQFTGRATVSISKVSAKGTYFLTKSSIYISIQIVRAIHIGLRETGMYPYVIGGTFIWMTRHIIAYPVLQNAVFHFLKSTVADRIIDGVQTKLAQAATEIVRDISLQAAQSAAEAASQAAAGVAIESATAAAESAATTVATQLIEDQIKSKASSQIVGMLTNFVTNPQVMGQIANGAAGLLQITNSAVGTGGGCKIYVNKTRKIKKNKKRKIKKRTRRNR